MDKMNGGSRQYYLDVIRIIACLMVMLMHSPSIYSVDNPTSFFNSGISYFTQPCIGLFFMVSGALLIPTSLRFSEFLRKRFGRVICPTIFWTIVYLILRMTFKGFGSSSIIIKALLSIPFSAQGSGVLWFMYVLIGFYLIIPVISPWIKQSNKREIGFYILLFVISSLYPFIGKLLFLRVGTGNILYYFSSYGGFFILGYYLSRYRVEISLKYLCIIYVMCLLLPIAFIYTENTDDFWRMVNYLSFPVVLMCVLIFEAAKRASKYLDKFSQKTLAIISKLSSLSFGVYLIHIAVMEYFLWNMPFIINIPSYPLQTFIIWGLTTLISTLLVWLISKLRFAKYIIG